MRAMRLAMFLGLTLMATAAPAVARSPVVVELYTAQGCASCREANINLGKLAEQPGVLALTFSVSGVPMRKHPLGKVHQRSSQRGMSAGWWHVGLS